MVSLFERLAQGRPLQEPTPPRRPICQYGSCSIFCNTNGPSPPFVRAIFTATVPALSGWIRSARSKRPKFWSAVAGSLP
jgi:hypothetical protein